jgi:ABC-type multidrug transport system ATPase subunit
MTTKETLDFYASVILPSSWPSAKKNERVVEVLDAVGLGHGHKTLVRGAHHTAGAYSRQDMR